MTAAQALGCLLYLLIYGRLPFAAEAKLQILNGDYSLPEGPSVPVVNLIRDLLQARWGVFEGSGPKVGGRREVSCQGSGLRLLSRHGRSQGQS